MDIRKGLSDGSRGGTGPAEAGRGMWQPDGRSYMPPMKRNESSRRSPAAAKSAEKARTPG